MSRLICPSCGNPAKTTDTKYGRRDDCRPCGLHSWAGKPLEDQATLDARQAAHDAFDTLWREGSYTRSEAYRLLAQELDITTDECHMAQMDKATALRVPYAVIAIVRKESHG